MRLESDPDKNAALRNEYPEGTRLVLNSEFENDPGSPPAGTKGTVTGIDDAGSIHVSWDNGSSLAILPDIDDFSVDTDDEPEL